MIVLLRIILILIIKIEMRLKLYVNSYLDMVIYNKIKFFPDSDKDR